jgi:hypothetical protein
MLPMETGLPARALRLVPYLTPEEVQQLCTGCRGRQQETEMPSSSCCSSRRASGSPRP